MDIEIIKGRYNDQIKLGEYVATVYTGNSYLDPDGGHEVFDLYVPTGSRGCRDGRMLVTRRPLGRMDRDAAIALAIETAKAEIERDTEQRARERARERARADLRRHRFEG